MGTVEGGHVVLERQGVGRLDPHGRRQGAPYDIHKAGRHLALVEKLDELREMAHVPVGNGADDAPCVVAPEPLHRLDHLLVHASALPVHPRPSRNGLGRRVERYPYADIAALEKIHRRAVKERGVGLDAETEVL